MSSDPTPPNDLAALRREIDALDAEILSLLNRRATIAKVVGEAKEKSGGAIFRPEREAQVMKGLEEGNAGPLKSEHIRAIYREVMSACRDLERTTVVAYLGPQGTFSEQAAALRFGSSIRSLPCSSIAEIFRSVETRQADFGVVPLENSSEGAIGQTLDLLLATPLCLCAEVALRIEHQLLSQSGELAGVTRVMAHPQALAQCSGWLMGHAPDLVQLPASSNGEAAREAAKDASVAAIAGRQAAIAYGLRAIAEQIQDDAQNTTRFGVIGWSRTEPSGNDRTSLALSVTNRAGAVYDMLAPLKAHGVSMTRFESRPARTGNWSYYFFIDIAGHAEDAQIARALADLKAVAGFYKVLGAYPVAKGLP
jgi:chorismate mutase/prephenate dehydratase